MHLGLELELLILFAPGLAFLGAGIWGHRRKPGSWWYAALLVLGTLWCALGVMGLIWFATI